MKTKDCKKGCDLRGTRKHTKGGIPAIVTDNDKQIEVESGEVVITAPAVSDNKVRTITGTNKQILNTINTEAGGVPIMEKGGEVLKKGGKIKEDRSGNLIGTGDFHVKYDIFDFSDYPQIKTNVHESATTESVYVTYSNNDNDKRITLRFSDHENNAVKFGDQLNGYFASRNEVLYKLGLAERVFIPKKYLIISSRQVSKKDITNKIYEEANLTIQDMYDLGKDADLSEYKNKLAKDSNYLILGNKVEEHEKTGRDYLGNSVRLGKYIYTPIKKSDVLADGGSVESEAQKEAAEHPKTFAKIQDGEIKTPEDLGESIAEEHALKENYAGGFYRGLVIADEKYNWILITDYVSKAEIKGVKENGEKVEFNIYDVKAKIGDRHNDIANLGKQMYQSEVIPFIDKFMPEKSMEVNPKRQRVLQKLGLGGAISNDKIIANHNVRLNGIEIKFPAKPDYSIIEKLKSKGFRWSGRQHLWYKTYNETLWNWVIEDTGAIPAKESMPEVKEQIEVKPKTEEEILTENPNLKKLYDIAINGTGQFFVNAHTITPLTINNTTYTWDSKKKEYYNLPPKRKRPDYYSVANIYDKICHIVLRVGLVIPLKKIFGNKAYHQPYYENLKTLIKNYPHIVNAPDYKEIEALLKNIMENRKKEFQIWNDWKEKHLKVGQDIWIKDKGEFHKGAVGKYGKVTTDYAYYASAENIPAQYSGGWIIFMGDYEPENLYIESPKENPQAKNILELYGKPDLSEIEYLKEKPIESVEVAETKPLVENKGKIFDNVADYKNWIEETKNVKILDLTEAQIMYHLDDLSMEQLSGVGGIAMFPAKTKQDRVDKIAQMIIFNFTKNVPDSELTLEQYAIKHFITEARTEAGMLSDALAIHEGDYKQAWENAKGIDIKPAEHTEEEIQDIIETEKEAEVAEQIKEETTYSDKDKARARALAKIKILKLKQKIQ